MKIIGTDKEGIRKEMDWPDEPTTGWAVGQNLEKVYDDRGKAVGWYSPLRSIYGYIGDPTKKKAPWYVRLALWISRMPMTYQGTWQPIHTEDGQAVYMCRVEGDELQQVMDGSGPRSAEFLARNESIVRSINAMHEHYTEQFNHEKKNGTVSGIMGDYSFYWSIEEFLHQIWMHGSLNMGNVLETGFVTDAVKEVQPHKVVITITRRPLSKSERGSQSDGAQGLSTNPDNNTGEPLVNTDNNTGNAASAGEPNEGDGVRTLGSEGASESESSPEDGSKG